MKYGNEILSPDQIINLCAGLDPKSSLVSAAKRRSLEEVDEFQSRAEPDLALLFNSLYANFHFGPDVMRALAEPSTLCVDPSQQKLRFKTPINS